MSLLNFDSYLSVQNYLQKLGFEEKEIILYITLLNSGPCSIAELSALAKVKRSTTHHIVQRLVERGMVSESSTGERRVVVAEDPQKLNLLLEEEKWRVEKLIEGLPSIVSVIQNAVPESSINSIMAVKYYKTSKEIARLFRRAIKQGKITFLADIERYIRGNENLVEEFVQSYSQDENIEVYGIVLDTPVSRSLDYKAERLHFKFIEPSKDLMNMNFAVFGDEVAILDGSANESNIIVINSASIAKGFLALHKLIWISAKE